MNPARPELDALRAELEQVLERHVPAGMEAHVDVVIRLPPDPDQLIAVEVVKVRPTPPPTDQRAEWREACGALGCPVQEDGYCPRGQDCALGV